jgi:hypothetical protein
MIDDRTATAYHEAGHAIVGHVLGLVIASVRIANPRPVTEVGPIEASDLVRREYELVTFWAGLVAEAGYRGAPSFERAADDLASIASGAFSLALARGEEPTAAGLHATSLATLTASKRVVEARRLPIERLAHELLMRPVLHGDALAEAFARALDECGCQAP